VGTYPFGNRREERERVERGGERRFVATGGHQWLGWRFLGREADDIWHFFLGDGHDDHDEFGDGYD
jgi:hypothetical protein